jgi:arginase
VVGFSIIEAPSNLGLKDTGVDTLPDALLTAGLADRLSARRAGRVESPHSRAERDPDTGMLNAESIAGFSRTLADAVGVVLDRGEFPLVLGGDCSILLGDFLALRRRGRYGLLFLDGHADFYQPVANVKGEVASSELAFATGRGPSVLTTFEGYCPLVRDSDAVAFGFRDEDEQIAFGSQPLPSELLAFSLAYVRKLGFELAVRRAIEHVARSELNGFWVHLDADVLADEIMPAVDYRQPGGLAWDELAAVLQLAMRSGRAVGLEITIFNPRLDRDGSIARDFVTTILHGLTLDCR